MFSNIRDAIRQPVEAVRNTASELPVVQGVLGTKLGIIDTKFGLLDSVFGADRGLLSLPGEILGTNGSILNGGILNGGLLNGGFLNNSGNGLLNGGLLNGGLLGIRTELPLIRNLVVDTLVNITSLPLDVIANFLDVLETVSARVPEGGLYRDDVRTLLTQRSILETYQTLETKKLVMFRDALAGLKKFLPVTGRGGFMDRLNLGLLDGIRKTLLQEKLAQGPLARLRAPTSTYLNNIFPVIGEFNETDAYLQNLSAELGKTFGIEQYPMDALSRILSFKLEVMNKAVDVAAGVVTPLVKVGTEITQFAASIAGDVARLLPVLPQLGIDLIFELLTVTRNVIDGVIDIKLGALEFIARIPLELLSVVLEIPSTLFNGSLGILGSGEGVLSGLWDEVKKMLGIYGDYSKMLGLSPEVFPVEYFADLSADLLKTAQEGKVDNYYSF